MSIEGDINLRDTDLLEYEVCIKENFNPIAESCIVYRWVHYPAKVSDFWSFLQHNQNEDLAPSLPSKEKDIVRKGALSVFRTKEKARDKYSTQVVRHRAISDDALQDFYDRSGTHLAELSLSSDDGYLGFENDKTGHVEFLPSADFDWEQSIVNIEPMYL